MPQITDPSLLAELNGGSSRPPNATLPPRYQTIRGPVDPYKAEDQTIQRRADVRADEDQEMQRRRDALTSQKDALAIEKSRMDLAAGVVGQATEGERNNEAFYKRAARALNNYDSLNVGPRSYVGEALSNFPGGDTILRALPDGVGDSPERRQSQQSQREFVMALIRSDSGANAPEPEIERLISVYFPKAGEDDAATLENYRIARRTALDALNDKAGRLAAADENLSPAPTDRSSKSDAFDRSAYLQSLGVNEGDEAKVIQFLNRNSGRADFSAQDVAAFYQQTGIRPPTPENIDNMVAKARKGVRFGPFDTNQAEKDYLNKVGLTEDVQAQIRAERSQNVGGVDAIIRGAADTASLGFSDEFAAGIDTLSGGTLEQNLARQRFIDKTDEEVNFGERLSGQIGGGFLLPAGIAGQSVKGAAAVAGGYGAAYGLGSGEGGIGNRLVNAAKGGVIGAAVGGSVGKLAQRFTNGGSGGPNGGSSVLAAANRQGIDVMPADVGGPLTRIMTAGAFQSPIASGTVTGAAQKVNDSVGARLSQIASGEGAPQRQEVFGDTVRSAANSFVGRTSTSGGALYSKARELAGDVKLQAPTARKNIDDQLKELSGTPNTSADVIAGLRTLGKDIPAGKKLSIDAMQRLRTNVREAAAKEGLRGTDYKRRANMVLDDLQADINAQLSPEASAAFAKADAFWKERLTTIDDTISEIIGPQGSRSSEMVAQRLVNMSRNDSARLRTFANSLTPEESGIVRGSIINEMGRATSGAQNQAGDAFSLQTFLTTYNKMPERTRALLFKDGSREAIDDLATIAEGARASRRYANTSGTAGSLNAAALVGKAASGGAAFTTLGASIPLEFVTAKLLASPRVARLLVASAKGKQDIGRTVKNLSLVASRDPALAPDINPLINALSQSPGRAAAQNEQQ